MKPIHWIGAAGGLLIVGVVVWYMWMQSALPYETTTVRGFQEPARGAAAASAGSAAAIKSAAPQSAAPR